MTSFNFLCKLPLFLCFNKYFLFNKADFALLLPDLEEPAHYLYVNELTDVIHSLYTGQQNDKHSRAREKFKGQINHCYFFLPRYCPPESNTNVLLPSIWSTLLLSNGE